MFFRITENWAGWTKGVFQNVSCPGVALVSGFPCYPVPLQMKTISFPLSSNFSGVAFLCMGKLQHFVKYRITPSTHSSLLSQCLTHAVSTSAACRLRARALQKQEVWLIKTWKAAALWPSVSDAGHWHGLCLIIYVHIAPSCKLVFHKVAWKYSSASLSLSPPWLEMHL